MKIWNIYRNWSRRGFWPALAKDLGIIFGIGYLFYGRWWCGLPGLVILPAALNRDYRNWIRKKKQRMSLEFREALQSMRTAMHAGYAAENAIREAIRDLQSVYGEKSDVVQGMRYMWNEIQMQIPAEQAWLHFGERSDVEAIRDYAVIFQTAKRSGGDMISIMDNSASAISEKLEVAREIDTLLAAKKMEWRIMVVVPFAIILYMKVAFPEFMSTMYGNPAGIVIMTICLGACAGAYWLGEKILRIQV